MLLGMQSTRHPQFFGQQAPQGLVLAYKFQESLFRVDHSKQNTPGASDHTTRGISSMYKTMVQPIKDLRNRFLSGLLSQFNQATNVSSGGARKTDTKLLVFLAHILADLPLSKGDEVCSLMYSINHLVSRRGELILIWLKDTLEGKVCSIV